MTDALHGAITRALGCAAPQRTTPLTGGCIHDVARLELADATSIVVKHARASNAVMFETEAHGLRALAATRTVRVPDVLGHGTIDGAAYLALEFLPPARPTPDAWSRLGADLAALHDAVRTPRAYGFDHDNVLGRTPQPNLWDDDWIRFTRDQRLRHQLDGLRSVLSPADHATFDAVLDALPTCLPATPPASLLHGDLWSGNLHATTEPNGAVRFALIDPACSYGDRWADLAMLRLFGGVPESVEDAYVAAIGGTVPDDLTARLAVYQLYHILNHVTLFGTSYLSHARALAHTALQSRS